jgi:ATP-dependent DNA helicase DinG
MTAASLPALHASHSGCWLRETRDGITGVTRPLGKGEAIMAAADTPLLLLNAPLVASRLVRYGSNFSKTS